jgi:hypothetical protein
MELGLDCGDLPTTITIDQLAVLGQLRSARARGRRRSSTPVSYNNQQAGLPPSRTDGIAETNPAGDPIQPDHRPHSGANPYYTLHPQIMAAFRPGEVDPGERSGGPDLRDDPRVDAREDRADPERTLTKPEMKFNTSHGTGCDIIDVIPCYSTYNVAWGPPYPDPDDPRNRARLSRLQRARTWRAPIRASGRTRSTCTSATGAMRYSSGDTIFDYQAWPLQPEGQWIGPIFNGSYLGAGLPFFQGRRSVWRDAGFDYGFVHGAAGIYNNYSGLIGGSRRRLQGELLQASAVRYPAVHVPGGVEHRVETGRNLERSAARLPFDTVLLRFRFGDFQSSSPTRITGTRTAPALREQVPPHQIRRAYRQRTRFGVDSDRDHTFYPPIKATGGDLLLRDRTGTADFFKLVIQNQGLADYNVQYGGSFAPLLDADAIVAYVREYFAKTRENWPKWPIFDPKSPIFDPKTVENGAFSALQEPMLLRKRPKSVISRFHRTDRGHCRKVG